MIERNMVSSLDEKLQPDWGKIPERALSIVKNTGGGGGGGWLDSWGLEFWLGKYRALQKY